MRMATVGWLSRVTGDPRFLEPTPATLSYYRCIQLPDGRLTQFYELGTDRPLYFTKDYQLTYSDADVPTHYAFKVSSKLDRIEREFEKLTRQPWQPLAPAPESGTARTDNGLFWLTMLMAFVCGCSSWLMTGESSAAEPVPATLRVTAVQFRSSRDLSENVTRIQQFLRQAAGDQSRVVVFPECALTAYDEEAVAAVTAEELQAAEDAIAETCREAKIYAIVGTPTRDGERLYNSAVVFTPRGTVLERYHKVQLAERWPTAGERLSVFPIDGVPCSIIICHDERYPELVRLPVLAGARVVFYLSNESGLRSERKLEPYRAQIVARAVENGVFIVHANAPAGPDLTDPSSSHGQSRLIAPDGNLIGPEASFFGEDVLTASLELKQATAGNALRSLHRGPLGDWWREGLRRVEIVSDDPGTTSR